MLSPTRCMLRSSSPPSWLYPTPGRRTLRRPPIFTLNDCALYSNYGYDDYLCCIRQLSLRDIHATSENHLNVRFHDLQSRENKANKGCHSGPVIWVARQSRRSQSQRLCLQILSVNDRRHLCPVCLHTDCWEPGKMVGPFSIKANQCRSCLGTRHEYGRIQLLVIACGVGQNPAVA
ncbi:hypothetical protein OBBRIDRAFT_649782 [Obba rivulosa]|uniref:Uncharacterized protein n=1 Tax=Obba rivulosa TaxID=1052685 RepID=A0A8E2AX24_9APHY|nr:hypothetical protein OBBRIDRAFT_649782 [Obba rivulosa]